MTRVQTCALPICIRSNIAVRNAQQEQALLRLQRAVLIALGDVENALVAYTQEKLRYDRLAEAVAANQRAVELSNMLYSRGLTSFLNVIESQRALYIVEDQLIESQRTVVANLISLYKALGGGWEDGRWQE